MIKIMKIDKVIIINVLYVHVIRYIIKIHRFVHLINAIAIKINTIVIKINNHNIANNAEDIHKFKNLKNLDIFS